MEAPPDIKVFREEICPAQSSAVSSRRSEHTLANLLSKVTLGIHLAQKLWAAGRDIDADPTLSMALDTLDSLEKERSVVRNVAERKCRALIVEDDANERELLAGLLGMNGCECISAADGEDALAYLQVGNRPDVVLLDMTMPRCNGPETLRRIRNDERLANLLVFSVSSTNPRELNIPVGPQGFNAWFPKPLNPVQLWDAIQNVIHQSSLTA